MTIHELRQKYTEECKKLHPSYVEAQIHEWVEYTIKTHPNHKRKLPSVDQATFILLWRIAIFACLLVIIFRTHC